MKKTGKFLENLLLRYSILLIEIAFLTLAEYSMQMQMQMQMQIYIIEFKRFRFLGVESRGIMDEKIVAGLLGQKFNQDVINQQ